MIIREKLTVSQHPIATQEVQKWRQPERGQNLLRDPLLVHWRQLVEVVHHVLLDAVEDEKRGCGDREENRNAEAKHERDEDNDKHR